MIVVHFVTKERLFYDFLFNRENIIAGTCRCVRIY